MASTTLPVDNLNVTDMIMIAPKEQSRQIERQFSGSRPALQDGQLMSASELLKQFSTSGAAVSIATATTHPIDVVKVRQQLETMGLRASTTNMASTASRLVELEGMSALYKGIAPALVRSLAYGGLRLGLYEPFKQAISGRDQHSLIEKVFAAIMSGTFATAVTNPMELAKVRLQAHSSSGAVNKSAFTEIRSIIASDGISGLWRGVGPSMARASGLTAAQLATYEESKQNIKKHLKLTEGLPLHLTASMVAGLVGSAVTSPFDVVKTRMMAHQEVSYRNSFHCLMAILRLEGPSGLYKGWTANYTRLAPQTAITFVVYEQMRRLLGLSKL